MAGGYALFRQPSVAGLDWRYPWFCLAVLASIRFAVSPLFSLLEGCGQLSSVYAYRLWDGTQAIVVTCLAVFFGAKLWTPSLVALSSIVTASIFLSKWHGRFFLALIRARVDERFSWHQEVLPLQWRIAVSWACGYFLFQLFTPVVFRYHGPAEAGRLGLTLSLTGLVSSLSSAWIVTKVPTFGRLVARRDWAELDRLAWRAGIGALTVAVLGGLAAVLGIVFLPFVDRTLASRLLDPLTAALFVGPVILQQVTFVQAAYLRAFKREPLLILSVVGATLVGGSTWFLGSHFGARAMAAGYLAISAVILLPVSTWIFIRLRSEWQHAG
ncbi:MAG: hypothetical protein EPO36_14215 [Chloroflexota bacterium]|nr:MAG: hypothetical protein EPO36_14215 [Chloroflexota bacterium]